MDLNSTPFLSYREIKTEKIDLYEDAYGLRQQFSDVRGILTLVNPVPGKRLTRRLIEKIRKNQ
ncbi:MAG: hypothetical protein ABSA76_09025 [Bacteroidales bacterium]